MIDIIGLKFLLEPSKYSAVQTKLNVSALVVRKVNGVIHEINVHHCSLDSVVLIILLNNYWMRLSMIS